MKVKDVMTAGAVTCAPEASLARAAELMWENDCGALPVAREDGRVVGLITDRDICFGAASKDQPPSKIAVGEITAGRVFACSPDDNIHDALKTMRHEQVRRLPVVGEDGTLAGVLSMNDVVLRAEEGDGKKRHKLSYGDVVETYKGICAHSLVPQVAEKTAHEAAGA